MAKYMFEPWGPYKVPIDTLRAGRSIADSRLREFWETCDNFRGARGCYIFAIRTGGGTLPIYVGKATKSFGQECFATHKLHTVNRALMDYRRGTLQIFFVWDPPSRGPLASRRIARLEAELIELAHAKNPRLANKSLLPQEARWGIHGVLRSGVGRRSSRAAALSDLLGL